MSGEYVIKIHCVCTYMDMKLTKNMVLSIQKKYCLSSVYPGSLLVIIF